jgi:DNA-binding CsgD family transcriptional regulator
MDDRYEEIRRRPGRQGPRYVVRPHRETPTEAQLQVVNALSHGLRREEVAVVLGVSVETVKTHLTRAKERTAAKTTPQLVAICLRHHWIT